MLAVSLFWRFICSSNSMSKGQGMSEIEGERVFIEYVIASRSPEVVRYLLISTGLALASFAFAWMKFAREEIVFGSIGLIPAIVFAVICVNSIWRYIQNRDTQIRITDQCVSYDSKSWGWEAVKQVDFLRKQRCLFFHVDNGFGRSQLSILVRVPGDDYEFRMQEVREFVQSRKIRIRDRGG